MHGPLRIIFPVTVILLWVLFGIGVSGGTWTAMQWLMLGLAHAVCAVIFIQFIYVFNYGYALSMAVISAVLLALMPSAGAGLVAGLAAAFGLRLLGFTHARYRAVSYAANVGRQKQASSAMPMPAKVLLWIAVSSLMGFQVMPVFFVARSGELTGSVLGGAAVMAAGLAIETLADQQKQAGKARDPSAFVSDGLFRLARHPNYLGEMIFQAGFIVAVLGSVQGWLEVATAVMAPAYVIILMYYAGKDADRQQQERYGGDSVYRQYRARTGCFLPGV